MSNAPAVLAVDPAKHCGIAMLWEGGMWCHTLKLRAVPPAPQELALLLAHLDGEMPWGSAETWHLVVERMYVGGNDATSIISAETAGMLTQELGRMREFASIARPYASQWRSILWQGAARLTRDLAKAAAIDLVERRFGVTVDDNAAEAVCIALWRQRELEHEAKRIRLGIDLPRKGKAQKRKPGAGRKRARATEDEILALMEEKGNR